MKDNPCIRVGHLKIVDHLILGIATGLQEIETPLTRSELETVAMNSWGQVCDALTYGEINGAFMPVPMAMDLFSAGLDIRVLMFTHRSGSLIVKSKLPGLSSIADFKGKTLLVPSEFSIQNMLVHRLLSTAGLTFGSHDDTSCDVKREVAHPFLMTEMMMHDSDGDIAGFAVAEPFGSEAVLKGIASNLSTTAMLWKDHPCCVFVLNASFIKTQVDAVAEVVSLFAKAGQRLENKRDAALLSLATDFLGKNITEQALEKTGIRFDPDLLIPDIHAMNIIQDYMTDVMGVFKHKMNINHLVEPTFILNTVYKNQAMKPVYENRS